MDLEGTIDLVTLYQREGYGLKKLSKLFGITPNAVKKRLRREGVYQGVDKERRCSLFPALLDLESWRTEGAATVRNEGSGLRLYLPDTLSVVSHTLSGVARRKVQVYVSLAPVSAPFGSLRFGLREGNREAGATAYLQGMFIPTSVWTVSLECRDAAVLFFQGGMSPVSEFWLSEAWVSP